MRTHVRGDQTMRLELQLSCNSPPAAHLPIWAKFRWSGNQKKDAAEIGYPLFSRNHAIQSAIWGSPSYGSGLKLSPFASTHEHASMGLVAA